MFGKHHTIKHLSQGIAIAALLAVIAVPSALAGPSSRRHADRQACQTAPTGWVTVTDDQGLTSFQPTGETACIAVSACTATADGTMRSPYPGWVFVTDDLGLPWLVPAAPGESGVQSESADGKACTPAQATGAADATTKKPAAKKAKPSLRSPHPNWAYTTDRHGRPWLVPAGHGK
jgi:hypothetical protein